MAEYYLGIDLGGTAIKAGLVDGAGKIVAQVSAPTPQEPGACMKAMVEAGKRAAGGVGLKRVKGVGILAPGQASLTRGVVFRSANLPLWRNVAVRKVVTGGLGVPGILENDANAAAYGEWWAGAGKGKKIRNLVMFTFGTGVGGGIVLDGKVLRGEHDIAAELGHMIVEPGGEQCGCGQRGCLETYASARYTARRAMAELKRTKEGSTLRGLMTGGRTIDAGDVERAAKKGDAVAQRVWDETCFYIGVACVNTVHWVDPEVILLGGGLSNAGNFLLSKVREHYKRLFWKTVKSEVTIKLAALGNEAGMVGAAGVAKDALKRGTAVMGK